MLARELSLMVRTKKQFALLKEKLFRKKVLKSRKK